jgi:tripartite-type tricarboxylate transporter receptor subunit TctC
LLPNIDGLRDAAFRRAAAVSIRNRRGYRAVRAHVVIPEGFMLRQALAAVVAALFVASPAQAQSNFPNRNITLVVPLPAGGTADILARIAAEQLKAKLGQNVIVENRAGGGGGLVGTESVFRAPPDGYTLLCAPQLTYSIMNTLNPKVSFDISKFEPVSVLAYYPAIVLVKADLPVNSIKELIDYAKANPGKLNYGSQGNGQIGHLAMEQFKLMTGTQMVHVPFRGSAPAITDLVTGTIDVLPDLLPATKQLIEAKKIKAIAVAGPSRLPVMPNLPTVAETLPGFEADTWMGVAAPPGTPKEIVQKLSDAIREAFASPEVRGRIAALDVEPRGNRPEEMAAMIRKSAERWVPVIRAAKITID